VKLFEKFSDYKNNGENYYKSFNKKNKKYNLSLLTTQLIVAHIIQNIYIYEPHVIEMMIHSILNTYNENLSIFVKNYDVYSINNLKIHIKLFTEVLKNVVQQNIDVTNYQDN
jgi:hypothetical protein